MSEGLVMLITMPQSAQKLYLFGWSFSSLFMVNVTGVWRFVLAQFKQHPGMFLGFVGRGNNSAVCSRMYSERQTTSKML